MFVQICTVYVYPAGVMSVSGPCKSAGDPLLSSVYVAPHPALFFAMSLVVLLMCVTGIAHVITTLARARIRKRE